MREQRRGRVGEVAARRGYRPESRARRPRWALLALLAAGAIAALAWVRRGEVSGQERWVGTAVVVFVAALLLVAWLLWGAGLRARGRWAVLAVVLVVVGGGVASVRLAGVTGDLRPVLAWRWGDAGEPAAPAVVEPAGPLEGAYPQFLGPGRDGALPDPGLARDWEDRPPREVWRRRVGAAWSGFAVADGVAVTQEQDGEREQVVAYEAATGRLLWRHEDRARYETTIAGVGPRATPTLAAGVVYTHGATGILNALDLASGRSLWSRHPARELDAPAPEWGRSGSPLLAGDLVVVPVGAPGAALVALSAGDGSTVWAAGDDGAGYSSPVLMELAGRTFIVHLGDTAVSGHDPESGTVLWRWPFPSGQPNVATPLALSGDRLLVSAGYGVGSKALAVTAGDGRSPGVRLLWESPRLKAKFTNPVVRDGRVYGLDDGRLVCLDPATGERCWRGERYGHGQTLVVGDLLVVQSEVGEIALVEADPAGFRELGRFRAFDGKSWNPPALIGRHLLLRTDAEAALFALPESSSGA